MVLRERLMWALRLIVDYHERALRILAGEYVPTTDELEAIVRLAKIDTEKDSSPELRRLLRAEEIEDVVRSIGGWGRIASAAAYVREKYASTWEIFEEYVTFAEPGGLSHLPGESVIKRLCELHDLDKDTVVRRRQTVIYLIAKCAIMCPDRQLRLPLGVED